MAYPYREKKISESVLQARQKLLRDAERAAEGNCDELSEEWINPELWSEYVGKSAHALYMSFTDQELLNILRSKAAELGRNPNQKEIFCVYRTYIRRRFQNWPKAMAAAGLKHPKTAQTGRNEK